MPIKDALKGLMDSAGLSQNELAERTNVPQPTIHRILIGESKDPRHSTVRPLADFFGVTVAQLRGDEPMPEDGVLADRTAVPQAPNIRVVDDGDEVDPLCYVKVERFNVKLSAGNGSVEWIPEKIDPLLFRRAWFSKKGFPIEHCKAMYVRGDSMTPLLMDWDTILVDTSDTELIEGEVYAVAFKGSLFVKQVARYEDGIKLVSLNEKYDPIPVPNSEAERFKCLGRMVWRGG